MRAKDVDVGLKFVFSGLRESRGYFVPGILVSWGDGDGTLKFLKIKNLKN